jgi:three-Cys-motif partner protein
MPDGRAVRPVRRWTVDKLAILAYYLPQFASICTKQAQGWYYFDGFAGCGVNVVKGEQRWYKGSALIALSVDANATGAVLVEQDETQAAALRERAAEYSTATDVVCGDSNLLVTELLSSRFTNRHLPAFCVLDPEGLELHWETVKALSEHRFREYTPYELMIYFPTPGVARVGSMATGGFGPYAESLARLFGSEHDEWKQIAAAYEEGRLAPGEAGNRYRALYRDQIRTLGYRHVIDRRVESERGTPLYHLIMATNNDVGARLLTTASEVAFLNNLPLPHL